MPPTLTIPGQKTVLRHRIEKNQLLKADKNYYRKAKWVTVETQGELASSLRRLIAGILVYPAGGKDATALHLAAASACIRDCQLRSPSHFWSIAGVHALHFSVRTRGGQVSFRVGEVIPLELSFSSAAPKTYQLDMAGYDRSGRLNAERFT